MSARVCVSPDLVVGFLGAAYPPGRRKSSSWSGQDRLCTFQQQRHRTSQVQPGQHTTSKGQRGLGDFLEYQRAYLARKVDLEGFDAHVLGASSHVGRVSRFAGGSGAGRDGEMESRRRLFYTLWSHERWGNEEGEKEDERWDLWWKREQVSPR